MLHSSDPEAHIVLRNTRLSILLLLVGPLLAIQPSAIRAQEASAPSTLSLDDALRIAHQYNPDYRVQESSLDNLGWQKREVWASFLPTATVSNRFGYTAGGERQFGDFTLGTQPAQLLSVYNLGLSLQLNGSSFYAPSVVGAQEDQTRAQVDGASASLVEQVTRAYLDVLQADEQVDQARTEVERAQAYVAQAQAQVAVGAATPLDVRTAEIQEGQAEVQLLQAQNSAATTRLSLMQALGTDLAPGVQLTTAFEVFDPQLDVERLVELAYEQNPSLRAAESQVSVTHSQTRMAQTQYLPSLSLSAGWSGTVFQADKIDGLIQSSLAQTSARYDSCVQNNRILALLGDPPTNCGVYDVSDPAVENAIRDQVRQSNEGFPFSYEKQPLSLSATVSLPIFDGFSRELQLQEAQVAEDNARRQVVAEQLRLRSEVEAEVRTVQTQRRIVELQSQNRENSAEQLRLAQERFRLGLASSIEVVDAQANLSQSEQDEISAVYEFHRSFAALESLVGVPLRDD